VTDYFSISALSFPFIKRILH